MTDQEPTKLYLDYLDKEMTIMGILASFCIAVVALALDKILGAKQSDDNTLAKIWNNGQCYVYIASVMMLLAAYCFYRQRARLSWYYGQICLCLLGVGKDVCKEDVKDWLKSADSWKAWIFYYTAFSFMWVSLIYYGIAIVSTTSASIWIQKYYLAIIVTPTSCVFIWSLVRCYVFKRHSYVDEPYKKLIYRWRSKFREFF